ncbi:hypothetical protein AGABI2DRAFT_120724 [Agaricus bisporus var. bisporus H97]|uniref:hypothetical protein n=1 Tax=Agaricus bisporus var. bisporus (strain H97 / ATCC MYA-4626 / FGSC 10389) TaxID=936046 RepID=UPI00029F5703|nr:hypothetical protein AGABI2DRAFT_120724 [Agaricus bisporus var. bisporus H97]EKV44596.1 hypothetical protein AGABI2DRAFT_120724 [Agaricus bisporus var. bisporus H97]
MEGLPYPVALPLPTGPISPPHPPQATRPMNQGPKFMAPTTPPSTNSPWISPSQDLLVLVTVTPSYVLEF